MNSNPHSTVIETTKPRLSVEFWIAIYAIAVSLIPPAFAFIDDSVAAVFRHFAADAFIYLAVAAKSQFGHYTFDGVEPTNGFHPLWQMTLQLVFQVFDLSADKVRQLYASYWLSVILTTVGSVLTVQTVFRWTKSYPTALLAVPGLFGLAMLLCDWPTGSLWSFMNGMESAFSFLSIGLLLFFLSHSTRLPLVGDETVDRRSLLMLSVLCTVMVFSRLDDIFLPAVLTAWLVLRRDAPVSKRFEAVLWFCIPLAGTLLAYFAFNLATVGHAMPVSAAAKFDLRTPLINIGFLGSSLHALVPNLLYDPFGENTGNVGITAVNWRNAQLLVPIVAARLLLSRLHWLDLGNGTHFHVWMRLLLIYVMTKGIYNFLFVPLIHQGNWYFVLSITIINLAGAVALLRGLRHVLARRVALNKALLPTIGAITAASLALFIHDRQTTAEADRYIAMFKHGPAITEKLKSTVQEPRILEADDGILNFALGVPTKSAFKFAIDPKAYTAFREGRFLSEAARRGYQLIGSLYYLRSATPEDLTPETIPDTLRENLYSATDWDLDDFDFELVLQDEATGAVFIRFTPKR